MAKKDLAIIFGNSLKEARSVRRISQAELARLIHAPAYSVSKWESGRCLPEADTICNISDVLEISVCRLFDDGTHYRPSLREALQVVGDELGISIRRVGNEK